MGLHEIFVAAVSGTARPRLLLTLPKETATAFPPIAQRCILYDVEALFHLVGAQSWRMRAHETQGGKEAAETKGE